MQHERKWTADQNELREAIEKSIERINTKLPGPFGSDVFPSDAWTEMAETGIFSLPFEPGFGGLGVDLPTLIHIFEGLGQTCQDPGFAFAVCTNLCSLAYPLVRFGSPELQEQYLDKIIAGQLIGAHAITEPDSGSSAFDMKTRAEKTERGWLLNGEKSFVSNAPFADMLVVYACTDPTKGTLSGFSTFLVPKDSPGLQVSRPSEKIGLKTSQFGSLFMDRVFVPDSHVIGRVGMGYSILDYVMKREILITFAAHIGQLQARFEKTKDYVKHRQQFGQRISLFQSVSHRIVDNYIALETAKMWLFRAAEQVQNGAQASRDVAIAKLLCSEANLAQAIDAVRLHGAAGYLTETGIGNAITDALGGVIYSGTSDIQRNRIAATLRL